MPLHGVDRRSQGQKGTEGRAQLSARTNREGVFMQERDRGGGRHEERICFHGNGDKNKGRRDKKGLARSGRSIDQIIALPVALLALAGTGKGIVCLGGHPQSGSVAQLLELGMTCMGQSRRQTVCLCAATSGSAWVQRWCARIPWTSVDRRC